ncbi:MAG: hypothetical protein RLZZ528_183, partial [Pseudomonadota bacterium]
MLGFALVLLVGVVLFQHVRNSGSGEAVAA